MKIAVLSGKGGVGKTFVAVNLAYCSENCLYLDCDVEEPNAHLFLNPEYTHKKDVFVMVPVINHDECIECRKCVDFCKFNALAFIKNKPLLFPDICHSCEGCALLCPVRAIEKGRKKVGEIFFGKAYNITINTGTTELNAYSGIPIISELLKGADKSLEDIIIDCPPGSACTVSESIKDADYCIMIAEPTIFGVHNLKMIYELIRIKNKPCGIILNKYSLTENPSENFAKENNIDILAKIPFSRKLSELISGGVIVSETDYQYKDLFKDILLSIKKRLSA